MNPEGAGPARETSTSSNQYFFPLNPEFSIAWRVGSGTRILTRLEIDTEPNHEIGIEYSSRVTTLVSSTRASQKVGMKTRPDNQSIHFIFCDAWIEWDCQRYEWFCDVADIRLRRWGKELSLQYLDFFLERRCHMINVASLQWRKLRKLFK